MSRHHFITMHNGKEVTVTLGFSRASPLLNAYLFLTVIENEPDDAEPQSANMDSDDSFDDERGEPGIVYSNLNDRNAMTNILDIDCFRRVLRGLGIAVPATMFDETMRDEANNVGNRNVEHFMDRSPHPVR